mmetsp:Transcript_9253/g.13671  ORF Transcript_9253/g.13671 Transcript_9253/m.13671 type:complete len:736 (-) Transcript_9253:240-2447(-)
MQRYSHCRSRGPYLQQSKSLFHSNNNPSLAIKINTSSGAFVPAYLREDIMALYSFELGARTDMTPAPAESRARTDEDYVFLHAATSTHQHDAYNGDCALTATPSACTTYTPDSSSSSIATSCFTCTDDTTCTSESSVEIGVVCGQRQQSKTNSAFSAGSSKDRKYNHVPRSSSLSISPTTAIFLSPEAQVFTPTNVCRSPATATSTEHTCTSSSSVAGSCWSSSSSSSLCQPCISFVPVYEDDNTVLHNQVPKSLSIKEKRKQLRYKTELCREYSNNSTCAFGNACHYAHGESELRRNRLVDLRDAGLVDLATHRVKLCFDWCATGDCPFGNRCRDIHDSNFKGKNSSWLPVMDKAEFKSQVASRLYVDQLHNERVNEVHNRTLFDKPNTAIDIYAAVGNSAHHRNDTSGCCGSLDNAQVSAKHQVEIALLMRATGQRAFSYKSNNLLGGKPCMVLQKRTFRIFGNELMVDVTSMPSSSRRSDNFDVQDVTVHEIVFDPSGDCDASKRALWFNVPDSAFGNLNIPSMRRRERRVKVDAYVPPQAPFELHTLINDDEFDIETEILMVYLQELKLRECTTSNDQAVRDVVLAKSKVLCRVEDRQRHIQRWSWPINADLGIVTCDTLEPKTNTPYKIDDTKEHAVKPIWESFLKMMVDEASGQVDDRLSCLIPLFKKSPAVSGSDVQLPTHHVLGNKNKDHLLECVNSRSESCWRSLLIEGYEGNDWDLIKSEIGVVY